MIWDPSIASLRQRSDFPLSGTNGLPQDDNAGPPEILSKYINKRNCRFYVLEVKNVQITIVSYGST